MIFLHFLHGILNNEIKLLSALSLMHPSFHFLRSSTHVSLLCLLRFVTVVPSY
ncbi:hypothetical protein HanRHA438_Chr15g0713461 [Helianthus annuus]|uniref:Uncharacterized protein n=1 Tax=Helianthus annuus TaxID=4232 RepID=A0A251S9D0_HELAN|nr:hypothetical protein HanXRQr2_Chr15g0701161 [Helianthus annuus]KAJ0451779.1 hypothetical protein HanHA300_Chr15g0571451 [Helianthus annuus]KAJ0456448.1 hypothetical protein HanIR_Chr15g0762581 [Helianthus annuus]KAJ0473665.1 hypothetical protein HanHA89_Chr15g0620921 [Helianthus annuus]KAJ0649242.1 hypothetical protein HanLR1_Chr15g0582021 [Helianthus annuus]